MHDRPALVYLLCICCGLFSACAQESIQQYKYAPRRMAEMKARSKLEFDEATQTFAVTHVIRSATDPSQSYNVRSMVRESEVVMIYMMRGDSLIYWGEPYLFLRHSNRDIMHVGVTVVDSLTQY